MRQNRNIDVVPVPLSIIKRIEGVFRANGHSYFVEPEKDHTKSAVYFIARKRTNNRPLVNMNDLFQNIRKHKLESAMTKELEVELNKVNLFEWIEPQKEKRLDSIKRIVLPTD